MAFGDLKGTLTANANSITNPFSATGSVAVVVGDLVFAVLGQQTNLTVTAATDNLGNTYSAVNAGTDGGTATGRAFYSRVTVAGTITSVSFTTTASTNDVAARVAVIEGPFVVSPLDKAPANNNNTDNSSPFTCPATGTLTQADEAIMAWMAGTGTSATWSATSPNLKAGQTNNSTTINVIVGYQAVTATTTVSPAFTGTNPTGSVQGTATFMRDMVPAAVGAAAGVATATAVGASTAASVGSSAGAADSTVVGASIASAVASASGSSAADAVGEDANPGSPTYVQVSFARVHVADSAASPQGAGTATGSSTVSGVGASIFSATGSATGTSTAASVGASTAASVGASDGAATVAGVGASTAAAVGSSAGASTVTAVGASTAASVGSSDGVATVAGVGASTAASAGSSSGAATATGVGESTAASVGEASGVATAEAVSEFAAIVAADASSAGTSTAAAVGESTASAVGSASGTSTADAQGTQAVITSAVAEAAGTSTAVAVPHLFYSDTEHFCVPYEPREFVVEPDVEAVAENFDVLWEDRGFSVAAEPRSFAVPPDNVDIYVSEEFRQISAGKRKRGC